MGNVTINIGGGFTGLLTIVFIVLKLIGEITWSWWWVLSPLWIPLAIGISILITILLVGGILALIAELLTR